MHRSGTSLVAEILQEMGLFIGKDLNIHYESKSILEMNNFILSVAHSFWDYPLPIEKLISNKKSFNNLVNILKDRNNNFRSKKNFWGLKNLLFSNQDGIIWGWKEPRTTLTFPFWLKIYPNAKFLFIYRNGVDVASSLLVREQKREGNITNKVNSLRCLDLDESFNLWEEYNSIFLNYKNLIDEDKLFCFSYEQFLKKPIQVVNEIEEFLGIMLNKKDTILKKINKNKKNNFRNNELLNTFYRKNKNSKIMTNFNYNKIT